MILLCVLEATIGAQSHFVAVPPESTPPPVKQFGVFPRSMRWPIG